MNFIFQMVKKLYHKTKNTKLTKRWAQYVYVYVFYNLQNHDSKINK
jgi:hypothetical protein